MYYTTCLQEAERKKKLEDAIKEGKHNAVIPSVATQELSPVHMKTVYDECETMMERIIALQGGGTLKNDQLMIELEEDSELFFTLSNNPKYRTVNFREYYWDEKIGKNGDWAGSKKGVAMTWSEGLAAINVICDFYEEKFMEVKFV